jgi:hypothetical protein
LKKTATLFAIATTLAMSASAQVWFAKNSTDPVTDERKGIAGVRSLQKINYDYPFLLYICDDEGERIQVQTREIHREAFSEVEKSDYGGMQIGNYVWFRIDGADLIEKKASMYGEYDNAPTVVRREEDPEFDDLLQSFRDAQSKIAVKTQQVTFTARVTGSNSKIGEARRFCGLE